MYYDSSPEARHQQAGNLIIFPIRISILKNYDMEVSSD